MEHRSFIKDFLIALGVMASAVFLIGSVFGQSCDYAATGQDVCGAGVISAGTGRLDFSWCSNTDDLECWVDVPAPSIGFLFTGPQGEYRHVAYVAGNMCVGGPQVRYSFTQASGGPRVFRVPTGPVGPLDTVYAQVWWRDYEDGEAAFTNAQRLVVR